jgi:hypothetical protein
MVSVTSVDVAIVDAGRRRSHADSEKTAMLLDELAALAPTQRRKVAEKLRKLSDTFAEVYDGKTASRVLGVLAHLLDPA